MSISECSKTLLVIIIVHRNGRTRDGVSSNLTLKNQHNTKPHVYSVTLPLLLIFSSHSQKQVNFREKLQSLETAWEKKVANVGHLVSWSDCPLRSWPWFYLLWVQWSGFLGMSFSLKSSLFFSVQIFCLVF